MFLSLAQSRRSIRKYQNKPAESEKIDQLVKALLRAPTSRAKFHGSFAEPIRDALFRSPMISFKLTKKPK
jgi:nitroreductase